MNDRRPAETFPPGEFIKEELEARGWTQDDLADILGRPVRTVNELVTGKRGITPETAKGLGEAFGTSAQLWMNLESSYRLSLTYSPNHKIVARRAALYDQAPVRLMIKRGWIDDSKNVDILEKYISNFFLSNMTQKPQFLEHVVARKSTSYSKLGPLQAAWLYRAYHLVNAVSVNNYRKATFLRALEQLKTFIPNPEDIRRIPKVLADTGVKLIIIEPLPQSKIDGASFWIDNSPIVVLSLRYDRIDWFWYTLIHELVHIKREDGKNNANFVLDTNLVGEVREVREEKDRPSYEIETDKETTNYLIDQQELDFFIARTQPLFSKNKIIGFANRLSTHPGVVVGQLQHRQEISYAHNREMLVKVRKLIIESTLTDGWGN